MCNCASALAETEAFRTLSRQRVSRHGNFDTHTLDSRNINGDCVEKGIRFLSIASMSDKDIDSEAHHEFDKAQTVDPEVRAHVYSLVTAVSTDQNI